MIRTSVHPATEKDTARPLPNATVFKGSSLQVSYLEEYMEED